jgi:tripartite-type tricarboxylate transporter receptor subunit TctC
VRTRRFILASLAASVAGGGRLRAEGFPSQPVKLVVPFPPGGGTDALARAIQEPMQKAFGPDGERTAEQASIWGPVLQAAGITPE